ncbi:MAG: hypothetical protein ACOX1S_09440 [Anaerostipes sp.]|jgi:hypothetical protein
MRKTLLTKGLAITLAAAMAAGPYQAAAFQGMGEATVNAAQTKESEQATAIDGMVYATVNMEYADFFYGELNETAVDTGAEAWNLTEDKVASYRTDGMYDAVSSATNTKSTKYATSYYVTGEGAISNPLRSHDEAKATSSDGTVTNTKLEGIKEVKIAIPEKLYKAYVNGTGIDKEDKAYEYLENAVYSTEAFDTEYKVLNADGTFSKMQTKSSNEVEDTDAKAVLSTSTVWGDYQISVSNLGQDDVTATTNNLYGIIVTDKDGNNYGMLQSDNTWLQTQEFSWAVEDAFSVHGENLVPYQRTAGLKAGNKITKITYLLKDAPDLVINTDMSIKALLSSDVSGSAGVAAYASSGSKIKFTLKNAPADDYTIDNVVKGARHGTTIATDKWSYNKQTGILTLDGSCVVADDYIATFKSATHGDIKVTFAVSKATQTITGTSTFTKAYGSKAFNLNAKAAGTLSYKTSDAKIATVSSNGTVTIKGTGIATITVTSTGANYNTATKKITVKVTPKKQTVKTKAGKKKVTVTLKKDTKATGYQIVIGTKKSLKGAKTVTVKSYKTYKKTISKLKAKKTYYVKARSYKTSGKTKLYGAYSTVKKVKTK